ncbi:MAG: hypothetical protein IPK19_18155 [Chloroflexi bacterium]|nr:hypothetical protein [Chloroflexota bacterium]
MSGQPWVDTQVLVGDIQQVGAVQRRQGVQIGPHRRAVADPVEIRLQAERHGRVLNSSDRCHAIVQNQGSVPTVLHL